MCGLDPLKRRDCSCIHIQKSHADEKNVKVMWKSQTLRQIDIRGTERVASKSRMTFRFPGNLVPCSTKLNAEQRPKCQELNAKKAEKASKRNRKSKEKSSSNQQLACINEHRVRSSQPVVVAPSVSQKRSFIDKTIRGKVPAAFCVAVSVTNELEFQLEANVWPDGIADADGETLEFCGARDFSSFPLSRSHCSSASASRLAVPKSGSVQASHAAAEIALKQTEGLPRPVHSHHKWLARSA
eukprot:jgi/Bigna1/83873/fgenesh1_pg.117_\